MKIRKFKLSDSREVSRIMIQAFCSFLGNKMDRAMKKSFSPEIFRQISHTKDHDRQVVSYVAEENGKVMGYIRGSASMHGLGTLEVVGIDPGCLHHGAGTLLMKALERFWAQKKMRKASTCVAAHNTRALIYYIRNGFIPEGVCRDHFIEGVDEIMLGKRLC